MSQVAILTISGTLGKLLKIVVKHLNHFLKVSLLLQELGQLTLSLRDSILAERRQKHILR